MGAQTTGSGESESLLASSDAPAEPTSAVPSAGEAFHAGLFRNAIANYIGQAVMMGSMFAITPFMLHRLGATQYGLWVLTASFVAFGGFLDLGVGSAVTKYVAELRGRGSLGDASAVVATALRMYSALGLIAMTIGFGLAAVVPGTFRVAGADRTTLTHLILVASVGIAVQLPATLSYAVLRGLQRYDVINGVTCAASVAFAASIVGVLLAGGGVVAIAAVSIPLTLLWQVPSILAIHRVEPHLRFGWRGARRGHVRMIAGFSVWLVLINAAGLVKKKTDEIVIGTALPVARIAPYSVARRLSDGGELVAYQFIRVIMPLSSHLYGREDHGELRRLQIFSTRVALAIFVPVAAVIVVLAHPILAVWVGAKFAGDAHIVVILACSSFVEIVLWPSASIAQATGRHRPIALLSAGAAVLNLCLSVVLVRSIGVTGVALGTLIATTVEAAIITPYMFRLNAISFPTALREVYVPALVPVIPAAAAIVALRRVVAPTSWVALGLLAVVGGTVYAAGYLTSRPCALEREALGRAVRHFASSRKPVAALPGADD
jgi:O-antigen/teichoic acid export membrane protein